MDNFLEVYMKANSRIKNLTKPITIQETESAAKSLASTKTP